MSKNRRRQWIVNEDLQKRIIAQLMWGPLLCLIASSSLLAWFCWDLQTEALLVDADLSIIPVFVTAIVFVIVSLGYSFYLGLRISNQVAGPIYNFDRTLKQVRAGDLSARIRLRKDDLLEDAAQHINELLEWVEETMPKGPETAAATSVDAIAAPIDVEQPTTATH